MTALVVLLSALGLIVTGTVVNGYVLSVLWTWFMVPAFGLPPLTIPLAIGLGMIMSFLTHQDQAAKRGSPDAASALLSGWINMFLKAGVYLLMGWIVHSFMPLS